MLEFLFCANNLSCQFTNLKDQLFLPKYPPDVAQLCFYFEEQKADLPDYCKWQNEITPPRRRSDF